MENVFRLGRLRTDGQRQDSGGVVRFPVGQPRNGRYRVKFDGGTRHPQVLRQCFGRQGEVTVPPFHCRNHLLVRAGSGGTKAKVCKEPLYLSQINPEPCDFDEPAAPANDLIEAARALTSKVAGTELRNFAAESQILRSLRIAQHDVGGAGKYEFAGIEPRNGSSRNAPAWHWHSDCMRVEYRLVGRQVGHPGCRLRLPVHDKKVPAAFLAQFSE